MRRRDLLAGGASFLATAAQAAAAPSFGPPQLRGPRGQFATLEPTWQAPPLNLQDMDGRLTERTLAASRLTLINFWATWCPDCRTELPTLDRLAASSIASRPDIIAICVDRDAGVTAPCLARELGLKHLDICQDPDGAVASLDPRGAVFTLYRLPITCLITPSGLVAGYMPGPADWTSPATEPLFAHYARLGAAGAAELRPQHAY